MTLPDALAGAVLVALVAYVLLGGADFGGGVWDLLARGPRAAAHRRAIADAIGPVWEANHVWLIAAIVILFSAFPPAFAAIATVLHVPLAGMLVGIVIRGSAFAFHHYDARPGTGARWWHRAFAAASLFTPLCLGICAGAIAAGRIHVPGDVAEGGYIRSWLATFPIAVGVLLVAVCAALAAAYIAVEARDTPIAPDFRRRALAGALVMDAAAVLVLLLARRDAPTLFDGLVHRPWSVLHLSTVGALALGAFATLSTRRVVLARTLITAQVALLVAGWGAAQYPFLVPPDVSIASSAAPAATLRAIAWALGAGAIVLIPSLAYLFAVFKGGSAFQLMDTPAATRWQDGQK